jgi:fatty-acyl-CoA synthase
MVDTVPDLLAAALRNFPARPALSDDEVAVTYAELAELVAGMAATIEGRWGVDPGRIAIVGTNSVATVAARIALGALGAAAIPVQSNQPATQVASTIAAAEVGKVLLTDASRLDHLEIPDAEALVATSVADLIAAAPATGIPRLARADGIESITFTSGSTGTPKAVVKTHESVVASALSFSMICPRRPSDVELISAPLTRVPFHNIYLATMYAGGSVRVLDRFDAVEYANEVGRLGAVRCFLPLTCWVDIRSADEAERLPIDSLRQVILGGQPIPLDLKAWLLERLPDAQVCDLYGGTEGQGLVVEGEDMLGQGPGFVGRPFPLSEATILVDGSIGIVDREGEILLGGPTLMREYLHPADNDGAFHDDWLRTGDLGRMDADGRFWVTGRVKDVIISGGYNVHAEEVSDFLRGLDGILEAAVVGVADRRWGEAVAAAVVVEPGTDLEVVRAHCKDSLAFYKVPKHLVTVGDLPRTATGKVASKEVVTIVEERLLARQEVGGDE